MLAIPYPLCSGRFGTTIDTSAGHEIYALQWASDFSVPALLVTLDLRLIWANGSGKRLLSEGGALFLSGDTLGFRDKSQANEFRSHLLSLGRSPAAWIYGQTGGNSGLIRAELIEPEGHPPVAAILIFRPSATQHYYWGDIGGLFGLTKAEVAVVKRMVDGESATVIAQASGVSLETVRTHIRRVYNKLDVVGREELIAKVSAYRTT